MKKHKSIYESIRKTIAPPTKVFKNKKEELLEKSINMDYNNEHLICSECGCISYYKINDKCSLCLLKYESEK